LEGAPAKVSCQWDEARLELVASHERVGVGKAPEEVLEKVHGRFHAAFFKDFVAKLAAQGG
jgi:hypothetical protein